MCAYLEAVRCEDVTLFAIYIVEECDVSAAVWIVLDRLDYCRYAILVALEIDETIRLLVTTTDVTHGEAALVVTTTCLGLTDSERLFGLASGDLIECADSLASLARSCGLEFADCHFLF